MGYEYMHAVPHETRRGQKILCCGCWEWNSSPLQDQYALLTTEPSLQPLCKYFIMSLRASLTKSVGIF